MVKRLRGLPAKIITAVGSIVSIGAHGATQADASYFLIDPEPIGELRPQRAIVQSFVQGSNILLRFGANGRYATWQGSNVLLVSAGPHDRASWE